MKFRTTEKKDKYTYYQTAARGGAIVTCVAVGTMLSMSFAPEISQEYSAQAVISHHYWTIGQRSNKVIDEEISTALQYPFEALKLTLLMKVNELSHYKDNWDGDGAVSPNKDAILNARNLIMALAESEVFNLDSENIYASSYGSVIMDFETKRGVVSVEMGDKSMGFYTDFAEGENYAAEGITVDKENAPEVLKKYLA